MLTIIINWQKESGHHWVTIGSWQKGKELLLKRVGPDKEDKGSVQFRPNKGRKVGDYL